MSLTLAKIGIFASSGTVAAGTAYGGYYVYVHKDTIFRSSTAQNPTQEKLKSELNDFVIAKVITIESTSQELYKESTKNYQCLYNKDLGTKDSICDIYLLGGGTNKKADINLHATIETPTTQLTKTSFAANDHVIVKLRHKALEQLKTDADKTFKIVSSEDGKQTLIALEFVSLIEQDQYTDNLTLNKSSLFVMKLSEVSSHTTAISSTDQLQCQIGSSSEKIACKVFGSSSATTTTYTHETLKGITSTVNTPQTIFTKDSYLVVELTGLKKSFAELENHEIVVTKTTDSQEIAKGNFDSLLIGNRSDTPNQSVLFTVENKKNPLDSSSLTSTQSSLILTKGATLHKPTQTLSSSNYVCRVVADGINYDDENCSIFEIDNTSTDLVSIDLSKYGTSGTKISDATKLGSGKKQVVSIKKHLQDKLATLEASKKLIHIIPTTDKDKAWNNRLVSLSFSSDLTKGDHSQTALYSNTFLFRVKEKKTTTESDLTQSTPSPLKCQITDNIVDCSVYKFASDQYTNALTNDVLKTTTTTIAALTDIDANKLLVVKFNNPKTTADLRNKTITLKNNDSSKELAILELDQILFGELPTSTSEQTLFPLAPTTESYIIEKDSTFSSFSSSAIGTTYRCSFTGSTGQLINYDDTCSLVKLEATGDKKVLTYDELIAATTKDTTVVLSSENKTFHKLIVNKNLLPNLTFTDDSEQTKISIESIPSSSAAATQLGQFTIKHKLSKANTESPLGKAHLLLGKVTEEETTSTAASGQKCSFSPTSPTTDGFDCELRKLSDIPSGSTDFTKLTIGSAVISNTESFSNDTYYTIDLKASAKSFTSLKDQTAIYYHYTKETQPKKVKFEISGILAGSLTVSNNLAYLKTPTTHSTPA